MCTVVGARKWQLAKKGQRKTLDRYSCANEVDTHNKHNCMYACTHTHTHTPSSQVGAVPFQLPLVSQILTEDPLAKK